MHDIGPSSMSTSRSSTRPTSCPACITRGVSRKLEVDVEVVQVPASDDVEDLSAFAELDDNDAVPILNLPPRGYAVAYRVAASGPPMRERRQTQRILRAARQGDPQARISLVG